MAVYLQPYSRRSFLKTAAIGLVGLYVGYPRKTDSETFVFISDTHIHSNLNHERKGVNLADNFIHVVQNILKKDPLPMGVIINGDLARFRGNKEDYESFHKILEPLLLEDIPVYLTLGNHDNRDVFNESLPEFESEYQSYLNKHILLIETSSSYLLLLDSLDKVNEPSGSLGRSQIQWVDELLPTLGDKNVLIFAHHFPETGSEAGLQDYDQLHDIITNYSNVKAYIYGHSHRWDIARKDSLYHINIPSTAYTFQQEQPLGHIEATFDKEGISLKLESIDKWHPWHGESAYLNYANLLKSLENQFKKSIKVENPAPNPFRYYTNIEFKVSNITQVSIEVFNIQGVFIKSLSPLRNLVPGEYNVQFRSDGLPSGSYLIRFKVGNQTETKMVTLIK